MVKSAGVVTVPCASYTRAHKLVAEVTVPVTIADFEALLLSMTT
jgi:hypothetical protein